MAQIPMEPNITPQIELCRSPKVLLLRDEEWACQECGEHFCVDEEGKDRFCITCIIKKSGSNSMMFFGWQIMRGSTQLIAVPPRHRVDG